MANGGRSSRSASGPLVSPPYPYSGGVWKAGVRLSGPSTDPRALLAVVRVVLVDRLPIFPEPGNVGWWRCISFPSGVCTRALLLAGLEVLLDRSRFCPLGARF
ncbi:uncharacterized protein LOC115031761 [Mus caroli]|uniref:Uncharacterized protein LOC115031761 n=1 Tax=Mus caroli TaxID=10089 RepID=A0A6P7RHY5_MUSCR|nr:uncharacterized protein LOC115031761 [Mus caroli]